MAGSNWCLLKFQSACAFVLSFMVNVDAISMLAPVAGVLESILHVVREKIVSDRSDLPGSETLPFAASNEA